MFSCAFDQARCKDKTIEIDALFGCITAVAATTVMPIPTTTQTPKPTTMSTTTPMMVTTTMIPTTATPTPTTKPTTPTTTPTTKPTTPTTTPTTIPTPTTTPTTPMPTTTPLPTRDQMQQLFCDNKDVVICSFDPVKVCGTDGQTYKNKYVNYLAHEKEN